MRQLTRTLFILLFILFLPGLITAQPEIDTNKLDQFFSELESNNRFMGSVAIMHGEDLIYSSAYGITDSDGNLAEKSSIYKIGSITKTYTAVMIFQLIEAGELSLDTTLDDFYPEISNADEITIRHLLQHRSGLVNFTALPDYLEYHTLDRSRSEMLQTFEQLGTNFEPATSQEYSNTGYVLLGYILEDITGKSYDQLLQEKIAEPLGLQNTYYAETGADNSREVDSFYYRNQTWETAQKTNMEIPHAAGAVVSTAEETAAFFVGLMNEDLLSESSIEEMATFRGSIGHGLIRFPFNDKSAIGHNGGIDGFQSSAAVFPEDGITFAVLSNGVNYAFNDILIGFLSIIFDEDYEIPDFTEKESIDLAEDQLRSYVGEYESANIQLEISLFIRDGNLMAEASGQTPFPLTIIDEQTMIYEPAGLELIFEPKEGELYNGFTLQQSGMQFPFIRKE